MEDAHLLRLLPEERPPTWESSSEGVQPALRRVAAQGRQQMLHVKRLWQNGVRAIFQTGFLHLVVGGAADHQHLRARKASLDVFKDSEADFRRIEHGRQVQVEN